MTQTQPVEDTRAQLKRLLEDADEEGLAAMHKKLTAKRPNICAARERPKKEWQPKHRAETLIALQLLRRGIGTRKAPCELPSTETCVKILSADVVEAMLFSQNVCTVNNKNAIVYLSVVVASLLARVVEECSGLDSDFEDVDAVLVEKNDRKHSPRWASMSARGSGLSANASGHRRVLGALESIEHRLLNEKTTAKAAEEA